MDDFASSALVQLITVELNRQGVEIEPISSFDGRTSSIAKSRLLELGLSRVGAPGILSIGLGIQRLGFHPVPAVLLNSRSVADLLERWQRLEQYYHGRHRVRILELSERSARVEHYSIDDDPPTPAEDLLIAGLLAALMTGSGAKGLALRLAGSAVIRDGKVAPGPARIERTSAWAYRWQSFKPASPAFELRSGDRASDTVRRWLKQDPGRNWRLSTLAREMALSTRTLQRQLTGCATNFQTLLREARTDGAAELLLNSNQTLADVGYATGFSDQAHFSRVFKQRFNLSPSEFRSISGQPASD